MFLYKQLIIYLPVVPRVASCLPAEHFVSSACCSTCSRCAGGAATRTPSPQGEPRIGGCSAPVPVNTGLNTRLFLAYGSGIINTNLQFVELCYIVLNILVFLIKWAISASFCFFLSFQTSILHQIYKSIYIYICWDSKSQPSEHESPPITAQPLYFVWPPKSLWIKQRIVRTYLKQSAVKKYHSLVSQRINLFHTSLKVEAKSRNFPQAITYFDWVVFSSKINDKWPDKPLRLLIQN